MAHQQQYDFVLGVKNSFPSMFDRKKVLEIGSLDINGSIRDIFSNCFYIGVDVEHGPGVDLACGGQDLTFADKFFDTSISCECFEHNPWWAETFRNMIRMTSNLVVFTCATTGRQEHGTKRTTPQDSPFTTDWEYYRNLERSDFEDSLMLPFWFTDYEFSTNPETHDLYFWGIRS